MPQSLSKVIIHIIFSTKERYPLLDANVRPRMHAYLATICRDAGAETFRVGGVADHVHLITTLPRTLSQADMLEGLKKKVLDGGPRRFSRFPSNFFQKCLGSGPGAIYFGILL